MWRALACLLCLFVVGCSEGGSVRVSGSPDRVLSPDGYLEMGELSFKSVGTEGDLTLVQWHVTVRCNLPMPRLMPVTARFLDGAGRVVHSDRVADPEKVLFASGESKSIVNTAKVPTAVAAKILSLSVHVGELKD
jgi:hypothetical protein